MRQVEANEGRRPDMPTSEERGEIERASATGMSQPAVSRAWRAFAQKPHQVETFKLSPDPLLIDKVGDIVGLYLNPPEAADVPFVGVVGVEPARSARASYARRLRID